PLPPGIDEYLLANWLRGEPVPFVKCITQDLEVPANAEIVIEGYLDPNEHRMEGPFGDHTGFYTPPDLFPVMHITAITHKRGAIYPATVVGKPPMEDYWMGKATERLFLPLMQLFMGEIVDVNMPAEGVFHNLVIVSIKPRFPGHAQKIMYGLWGLGLMMLTKAFIIVDDGIDVHDLNAVANCVLANVDWRRDITIVDGAVDQLDHSAIRDSYGGKIGLDATCKPDRGALRDCFEAADERLTRFIGENWYSPREGLVIAGIDKEKRSVRDAIGAIWSICPDANLIAVDVDVDTKNLSDVAWRVLGNVDWRRDIIINTGTLDHFAPDDAPRGQIAINATVKDQADGHTRGWPQEVGMSAEIVARVDEQWEQYGIPHPPTPSPSNGEGE
ncbi:MAG: UbiD family decarboxylase, partial [Anaerolineae bacterium]|nr:UbiD family decarboxylase [Anaerolineae bacterium]